MFKLALDLEGAWSMSSKHSGDGGISGVLDTPAVACQTFLPKMAFAICFQIAWPYVF